MPSVEALPQLWTLPQKMQHSSITYGAVHVFKSKGIFF